MVNKQFFQTLKKDYRNFAKSRREIIGWSSDALHKSKVAIFSLHRGELKEAEKLIKQVEKNLNSLEPLFKKIPALRYEGSYRAATEEYVEAKLFYKIITQKRISVIREVKLNFDSYIGGLSDVTGELVRLATQEATKGKFDRVGEIKDIITEILANLVELNLTSYLRTKYDQAKNNLKKIEHISYEIKMKK